MTKYFKPQHILELGTSLGKATYAIALAAPKSNIITVEGDQSLARFTDALLKQFHIKNVQVLNQDFDTFLKQLNTTNQLFDMVFMDGNHQLKPTIAYFEKLQKHLHNNSVVIVDDIYWSDEMKQAWQVLKNHPNVKQSIDLFHFGLLFFRDEQFPQDFTIRFSTFNLF
jgi:predicted O-methyltransferase YrrM